MQTPTESDFSPLPELISRFGLPNPLEILPQLINRLEAVDSSSTQLNQLHTQLTELADHIDTSAGQLDWHGHAASSFQGRRTEVTQSLRNTAAVTQDVVHCHTESETTIWDLLVWITLLLAILVIIIAFTFALAIAASGWTFGSSLLLWLADATGLSMTAIAEIAAGIGTALWLISGVLSEVRGKVTSPDIVCPVPNAPAGSSPLPSTSSSPPTSSSPSASPSTTDSGFTFPGTVNR